MARKPRRSGPPELAQLDTRARLLLAARQELVRNGLRATKVAAICRRAQLANGTFYVHFRSVEDVYKELLTDSARTLGARLAGLSKLGLDARARDRADIEAIFAFAEEHQDLFRIMVAERTSQSIAHNVFFANLNEQRRQTIAAGVRAGRFRRELDPLLTAVADFGITTEIVQWWLANRKRMTKQHVIDKLVDLRARMFFPD